jgi:hypothetical protein
MTEHDRDLVMYAIHEKEWSGILHGEGDEDPAAIKVYRRKLSDFEVKALLDDSTSGGIEIAPIEFDDALVPGAYTGRRSCVRDGLCGSAAFVEEPLTRS